ncbi:3-coathanger stack domain-containing protein [Emticicia sp. C21]|uniref:3-coathanger stack domain-containing protein n=1 Tax=Emticicia sp. C21 TaxID=2302915 RepID=UPI000E8C10C7|nr:3-coathanger stack domain-containing protein [Emticicia sp. C21]RFS17061.1 hypothetical protein D0T08_10320 [Emticicia sp. C21]
MKKVLLFLFTCCTSALFAQVSAIKATQVIQAPVISGSVCGNGFTKLWDNDLGGNMYDLLFATVATDDGGFLLGGSSISLASWEKSEGRIGRDDYWIIKIDANGHKLWDKTLGTANDNFLRSIIKTNDGGFLLGGFSFIDQTKADDFWIIKIDANGNHLWDKFIGSNSNDNFSTMTATNDGGFLLFGTNFYTASGDKTAIGTGEDDFWVVKIDAYGNKIWDKALGGTGSEKLNTVIADTDGGYLLGGYSHSDSSGQKSEACRGNSDYWIVKIDAEGNKIWDKTFGGSGEDGLNSIICTADGKYLLGGYSASEISGDKTGVARGSYDFWVIKVDALGNKIWDKSFGGDNLDMLNSMLPMDDGGYLIGGTSFTSISGDKTEYNRGYCDFWLIKTDAVGNKVWDKTLGGNHIETLVSMLEIGNGNYLLTGTSVSDDSGDKTVPTRGVEDYWAVKINTCQPSNTFCEGKIYTLSATNCAGTITWSTGATTNSIQVNNGGTYTATCTINNETSSVSNSIVVTPNTVNLNGNATNGTNQAVNHITSTQIIPTGINTTYQAGKSISLQGTFHAQMGSVFKAEIKGCE